ncbi:MAG: sugar phosphate nucleotidyltransferase [Clostridium sp.]|nr:sugar phosphate nucleotidyltransferase [Clostridium sp.]
MNYMDYCIDVSYTIKDAMKCIEIVKPKIVFIVEDKKLKASLTDGDVRRFLLAGGALSDLAMDAGNKKTLYAETMAGAMELYHKKNFVAIPIVNDKKELTDIYIGEKSRLGKQEPLNIPVVINAGGKGTRLEPYTKILPKPLIPVGDMPIIEHIMQNFIEYSCEQFSIIVNYKKDLIKAYFSECEQSYNIEWYNEDKPLGTGGGLCYLKGKIDTTFFFTNCDNLLLADYGSMLRFHRQNENVITMVCAYKNIVIPYGVVDMGLNGTINSMQEKPELSFLTNTGIYIVEPEVLDDIEDNTFVGFPDIVKKQMEKGNKVSVYPVSENEWLDMGQLPELEKMRERLYGE